jgi:hypothetical protein
VVLPVVVVPKQVTTMPIEMMMKYKRVYQIENAPSIASDDSIVP